MSAHQLASLLLVLAACQRPRAVEPEAPARPAFRASCDTPLGVCTEYSDGAFALGEAFLETSCHESRGTWSPARCPAEERVGRCAARGSTRVYFSRAFSPATAETDCVELHRGEFAAE